MWAGACTGELLGLRGGLEWSDLDYLRSAVDGKWGPWKRQPTKHARTHTHKLKPLNHFTVVPHSLSALRFNAQVPPPLPRPESPPPPPYRQARRRATARKYHRTARRTGHSRQRRRTRALAEMDGATQCLMGGKGALPAPPPRGAERPLAPSTTPRPEVRDHPRRPLPEHVGAREVSQAPHRPDPVE